MADKATQITIKQNRVLARGQTCEDGSYDAFARVTCAHVANDGTSMRTSAAIDVPIKHSSSRRGAGAWATATGLLDMAVQVGQSGRLGWRPGQ